VDFRTVQNLVGSPARASVVGVEKKFFAGAADHNIQEILLKINFYRSMRLKEWQVSESVVFFKPHYGGPSTTISRGTKIYCQRIMPSTVHDAMYFL